MNNSNLELTELMHGCNSIAMEAASVIMDIYSQDDFETKTKQDNSPVTKADIAAPHTIVNGLHKLNDKIPVLSEEAADIPYSTRQTWEQYWLVDPLDGTRDFIAQTDGFSVNIALIQGNKPVLGVIAIPVTGECFYTCNDTPAYKSINLAGETIIRTRQPVSQKPVIIVSGLRKSNVLSDCLSRFDAYELIYSGSSIKSCRIAEGSADFYPCLGPTSEWDTGAGQIIVERAGGKMTNLQLQPLHYNQKESLTNPWFIAFGDTNVDWSRYLPENAET